ncbi:hypothetical protein [Nonomuraea salmonea]|uniref:hypothetical protein n=1 Tax=Nonomuraea salmonea TaxID=46181 RepID=UPI0031EA6604
MDSNSGMSAAASSFCITGTPEPGGQQQILDQGGHGQAGDRAGFEHERRRQPRVDRQPPQRRSGQTAASSVIETTR